MILLQVCLPFGKFRNAPIFHRLVIVAKLQQGTRLRAMQLMLFIFPPDRRARPLQ